MTTDPLSPDLADYIAERTRDFTGRAWVFRRIDEWLAKPAPRFFRVEGGPGSGKTAIAARLAQISVGTVPPPEGAGAYPHVGAGFLAYAHFCRAGRDTTLHPLRFLESLSQALAGRYAPFAEALRRQAEQSMHISYNITQNQNVGTVAEGGNVIGVNLNVRIGETSARLAFDTVVRKPLEALYASGFADSVVILVDSLDEALTFNEDDNLVNLLTSAADLPPKTRWLLTSRNDDQVQNALGDKSLDLIDDAPAGEDDIRAYAFGRLSVVDEPRRSLFADQIAQCASGNFLYARYVLDGILPNIDQVSDVYGLQLPKDLEDQYRTFLKRELGRNLKEYARDYRTLLGSLAVARGRGLRRAQLAGIINRPPSETGDLLAACDQYLAGAQPDGPFRIYHQSFRDFLLRDNTYRVYPAEANAAIAGYLLARCGQDWDACADDYAVQHAPEHLADSARQQENPERHAQTARLVQLAADQTYQRRITDLNALQSILDLTLRTAAMDDDPAAPPLMLASASALLAFKREYLRPQTIFELAIQGKVDEAEQRLALFGPEPRWRQAAQLLIAWLAVPVNRAAARAVRERLAGELMLPQVLQPLLARLDADLNQQPVAPGALQALPYAPPREVVQQIVQRMGGGQFNPSFLLEGVGYEEAVRKDAAYADYMTIEPDDQTSPSYIGTQEGPLLVAFAVQQPDEGTALLREYIGIHAANNYVYYRNMSLWGVLDAIMRNPDPAWTRTLAGEVTSAALTGSQLEFNEGVSIALAGLPDNRPALEQRAQDAVQRAAQLSHAHDQGRAWGTGAGGMPAETMNTNRGSKRDSDAWGSHTRRLATFAEAFAVLFDESARAAQLLEQATKLPRGFAGYRAMAMLTLAEAMRIAGLNADDIQKVIDDARRAAHNVTDPIYCVRSTARVTAIQTRWPLSGGTPLDLAAIIPAFVREPDAPTFAALHIIGENYGWRDVMMPVKLPLPPLCYQAVTLEQLARVYQQPLAEFRRLNPKVAADATLAGGTPVNVPDPEFAPLLAARLAAEALVAPGLSNAKRASLIQMLVPVAAANPTALDSVLARLLLAARPQGSTALKELLRLNAEAYAPHTAPTDTGEAAAARETNALGPA